MSKQSPLLQEEAAAPQVAEAGPAKLIGRRVGNYLVERPIAKGGMGSVYVAKHPQIGREVAVKFLSPQLNAYPELCARFLSEARIAASLNHPNIVDILDFGELEGRSYYIMELLRGEDLGARMKQKGRFTPLELLPYLEPICSALGSAHAAGVVHRDLKPANVFVVAGEPERIKLVDFGVAKLLSAKSSKTRDGQVLGTPSHMSPEQALGDSPRITPQSDLYSLGVILYEMLAGVPLFTHESDVMLMAMHVRDHVRPLREHVPAISEGVARVVEACLAKEPRARPSSARSVYEMYAEAARAEGARRPAPAPEGYSSATRVSAAARIQLPAVPPARPAPEQHEPAPPSSIGQRAWGRRDEAEAAPLSGDPAAHAEASGEHEGPLSSGAQQTLNKLMLRLKRQGDFPAFMQTVGEVSKKADAMSAYSASQLGETILKDYALTAKLLRVVNSTYASRFGGKIYSVQHAIVILGFDRVRSLALSISLFKSSGKKGHSHHVSDSAISSLVSGEIAKGLAWEASVNDEEAMVCAMFRDLGRHLVVVYLTEYYEQIMALVEHEGLSLRVAAERVLGTSFARLGVAVAQTWRLPARLIHSITALPTQTGALTRPEDKLSGLAEFANEVCAIVATEPPATRERALTQLVSRHKNLLSIDAGAIADLLENVQGAFEERYAVLLGLDVKASRFMNKVSEVVESRAAERRASLPPERVRSLVPLDPARNAAEAEREKAPQVARVNLAKRVAGAPKPSLPPWARDLAALDGRALELRAKLKARTGGDGALKETFGAFTSLLGVRRALLLVANAGRDALVLRHGLREDIEGLAKELFFPLKLGRGTSDLLSCAYQNGRDVVIEDAFAPRVTAAMPARYYEVLGSPAFVVLACSDGSSANALVLVDADSPLALPTPERIALTDKLRPVLAQAAVAR